jgi:ribonucleoside-diphosphate reductase alpha chain
MAFVPGSRKQQNFPSTVSYVARLILHRYAMLGILDENGIPRQQMGILERPALKETPVLAGAKCPECGNKTLIRKDGCDYCTACGYVGICG